MTTFHWPKISRSSWWLAGFIFLSLFLHSAAFFLFQVITPLRPPTLRPAQPVQVLTVYGADGVASPENAALLEWIASEDPALIARGPEVLPPDLLKVPYRPSYTLAMRTAPLNAPEETATIQFPSARAPIALILGNQSPPAPPAPPVGPQTTKLTFSETIQSRAPGAGFAPAVKSNHALQPTRLLLGINADGDVRFAFLQQPSSGDPGLDAEAATFAQQLRFAPAAKAPITWGFATFLWGDDATTTP